MVLVFDYNVSLLNPQLEDSVACPYFMPSRRRDDLLWPFPSRLPLLALDRVWVRPRPALLALKAHRSPLAAKASDHLPVKAIVATQALRWDPYALSNDVDTDVGKFPIYAGRRGS